MGKSHKVVIPESAIRVPRRTWGFDPTTRVVPSGSRYVRRSPNAREFDDELAEYFDENDDDED